MCSVLLFSAITHPRHDIILISYSHIILSHHIITSTGRDSSPSTVIHTFYLHAQLALPWQDVKAPS